jgi:hypothetical protein
MPLKETFKEGCRDFRRGWSHVPAFPKTFGVEKFDSSEPIDLAALKT